MGNKRFKSPVNPEIRCDGRSKAMKETIHRVSGAIDAGRKPGMPLSIWSNLAREAPLSSLLVAFLLGAALAHRE